MDDPMVERLRATAPGAFEGSPVRFAYLFGSRARGQARKDSDVDIAVFVDPSVPDHDRFRFGLSLSAAFERACRAEVNIVVLNDAPLELCGRVVTEGLAIFSADDESRAAYESRVFREYADFRIFSEELARKFIRDIAAGKR